MQCLLQILCTVEAMRVQHLAKPSVETLHHAVGAWCSGACEPVLYPELLAQQIKLVITAWLLLVLAKQTIRELFAVVREDRADVETGRFLQGSQKCSRGGCCLVLLDLNEHPTRSSVNGHKDISALVLVLHLRQVFHIDMHIARLIGFERLAFVLGSSGRRQARMPSATQQSIQRRAAHRRFNEFVDDCQQVIQRQ